MKCLLLKLIISVCFSFIFNCLFSQVYSNDAGTREKHFIYEVKQIDEFFERFNNDSSSFVREVYKSYGIKYNITRTKLIKSLFNYETNVWETADVEKFIKSALQVQMPNKQNYYGDNWFAEAVCTFEFNSSTIEIPLILKIITDEGKRSKWSIVAVNTDEVNLENSSLPPSTNNPKKKFINPASHGNNFIELEKDFADKENLSDYFDESFFLNKGALPFYNAILKDRIKFQYVKTVKYHFLQVDKYIFTVEYFQREALNSGWLINNLKIASASDKEVYAKALLRN